MTAAVLPKEQISVDEIKANIGAIPDFPIPGILFRDMMPVIGDAKLLNQVIDYFYHQVADLNVDYVAGIESRGFILGTPLACKLGVGFVPIRKAGKLPGPVERYEYELEYGSDVVEVQKGAIPEGARVVLIDDLLATGGTAGAACTLLDRVKADTVSIQFMIELAGLNGREKLPKSVPTNAMIEY